MEKWDFDKWIRESFEKMEGHRHVPPHDWKSFEDKLVETEIADDNFDQIVKEKLTSQKPAYNPAHWMEYLYKSSLFKLLKVDFLYNKISEAFILTLALALILPANNWQILRDFDHTSANAVRYLDGNNPKPQSDRFAPVTMSQSSNEKSDIRSSTKSSVKPGNIAFERSSSNLESPTTLQRSDAVALLEVRFIEQLHHRSRDYSLAQSFYSSKMPTGEVQPFTLDKFQPPVFPLAAIKPSLGVEERTFEDLRNHPIGDNYISNRSGEGLNWLLSTFLVADINTIHTPYDEIYQKAGYEQTKFGMGGGLGIGLMRNGWAIELGLVYSMKQYNPREILEVFRIGNDMANAVSLKSIELNTLSIPLTLRYDLSTKGRWIPYMKMGIGLNLATNANYQREEYILSLSAPIPSDANINYSQEAKLDEKRFTDGLFEGGKFSENSYLSANGGLGVDFRLSPDWRIFAQGSYQYNFLEQKLGPNNDHINTITLQMGVRHQIRR